MRRDERVTVQGPVKKQQPDGMSHGEGGRDLPPPPHYTHPCPAPRPPCPTALDVSAVEWSAAIQSGSLLLSSRRRWRTSLPAPSFPSPYRVVPRPRQVRSTLEVLLDAMPDSHTAVELLRRHPNVLARPLKHIMEVAGLAGRPLIAHALRQHPTLVVLHWEGLCMAAEGLAARMSRQELASALDADPQLLPSEVQAQEAERRGAQPAPQ